MECMRKHCTGEVVDKGLCGPHLEAERERKRQVQLRYMARVQADPEKRAKANAKRNEWRKKTAARRAAELRERYANDPEFRERVQEQSRRYREQHPERIKEQAQARNEIRREQYATDAEYREKMKANALVWASENRERKSETDRKWREANPEKVRANNRSPRTKERRKQNYAELKMEVLLAYGDGSCAWHRKNFGTEFRPDDIFELELHHINGDGAAHRRQLTGETNHRNYAHQFYRALKDRGWPRDTPLITLCGSCHKKATLALQRGATPLETLLN